MNVDVLVSTHLALVDHVAQRYRRHALHDDLVAAGRMGLFSAARSFDACRGVPFVNFARRRIRGAMTDQLRSFGHLPRDVYRRAIAAGDPIARSPLCIDDIQVAGGASPEDAYAQHERLAIVRLQVEGLAPSERAMVRTVLFDGANGNDAAARLGLSKSWGSRLLARAVRQLTKLASRVPPPATLGGKTEAEVSVVLDSRARRASSRAQLGPRARTENVQRLPQYRLEEGRVHLRLLEEEPDLDRARPVTRGDCANVPRPCPFVSCRQNTFLDVNEENGSIRFTWPDKEPNEVDQHRSCALDIADRGGGTLEDVGELSNVTRERIRQIETKALVQIRRASKLHRKNPSGALREFADVVDENAIPSLNHGGSVFKPAELGAPSDDAPEDDVPPVAISFFADAGDDAASLNDPVWDRALRADDQITSAVWGMFARRHGIKSIHQIRSTEARTAQRTNDDTKRENTSMDASTLPPVLASILNARNDLIAAGKEPTAGAIAELAKVTGANEKLRANNVYNALARLKKKGFLDSDRKKAATSKPTPKRLPPPAKSAPAARPIRTSSTNATVTALIEKRDSFRRKADALDVAIEALSEVL